MEISVNRFDHDQATGVLEACEPPCISLYQPTHRRLPDIPQDTIRFRNLLKSLEEQLASHPKDVAREVLAPFAAFTDDAARAAYPES